MSATVDIAPELLPALRRFRLAKRAATGAAFVVKIDKKQLLMEEEEVLDPTTPEDLAEELPEHSPRFVVLSYELRHSDGRISYVCMRASWAPASASMELATLYASALSNFSAAADVGKVIDIRDGVLTDALLRERLGAGR
ncbi:hypothetical protein MSPP1_003328 [Malassezia sp. CBS 17886]|nr:hypothetical protein MSPP1_003328 [Malassezia sp. CBS 17886]